MGGRGSKSKLSGGSGGGGNSDPDESSVVTGLDVTFNDGETIRYYFESYKGQNFYQRGISGMMEPTPLNMSKEEFKQRAEKNGAVIKPISNAEYEKANAAYQKAYDSRPDYEAGTGMVDNRDARRNARRVKINNRTSRRHRSMNV